MTAARTPCKRLVLACLIFSALFAARQPARAEIVYTKKTVHFDIGYDLQTKRDILKAMRRIEQLLGGRHVLGSATPTFRYKFKARRSGQSCTIAELTFNVDVKIRLPEWQYEFQAGENAKDFFSCLQQTVSVHEDRHAAIYRETAQEMEHRFLSELQGIPCSGFNQHARSIFDEVVAKDRRRNKAFDAAEKVRRPHRRCEVEYEVRARAARRANKRRRKVARLRRSASRVTVTDHVPATRTHVPVRTQAPAHRPAIHSVRAPEPEIRMSLATLVGGAALLLAGLAGVFVMLSMQGAPRRRFELARDEPAPASDDWTKRALRAVSEESDSKE